MTPGLTIFTTCKPFVGRFSTIQRNAIGSWARLAPECEVIVFGDEPGVRGCCRDLGVRHEPEVPRSEYGTPVLDGLFERAERKARADALACVNADIILTGGIVRAVREARRRFPRYLLIGRRWNVDLEDELDPAAPDWEARVLTLVRERGVMEPAYRNVDLFAYSRGLWDALPPFAIGRGRWDSALIYRARRLGAPVIDATEAVTSLHQNHDYSHHPGGADGVFRGVEAARNERLLGGPEYVFTALNATHVLGPAGIRRRVDLRPSYLLWKLATLPALHPWAAPLSVAVRAFVPWWRRLSRARRAIEARRRGGAAGPAASAVGRDG